jgi:hypothetical protein
LVLWQWDYFLFVFLGQVFLLCFNSHLRLHGCGYWERSFMDFALSVIFPSNPDPNRMVGSLDDMMLIHKILHVSIDGLLNPLPADV